jgi:hypothetical protein
MSHPVVNTVDYTPGQLVLFGVAAAFWVVVYIMVIAGIIKTKFIGIPALAICANFAWEFLWSFKYYTNMGALFEWGYRAWFILDVFIFWSLLRIGKIQFSDLRFQKNFIPVILFTFLCWVAAIFALTTEYADPIGAVSAYLVNVHMSALYLLFILKFPNEKTLSVAAAWFKMLGTALTSVFCFWVFPTAYFMLTLTVITFILDMTYIYLVSSIRTRITVYQ